MVLIVNCISPTNIFFVNDDEFDVLLLSNLLIILVNNKFELNVFTKFLIIFLDALITLLEDVDNVNRNAFILPTVDVLLAVFIIIFIISLIILFVDVNVNKNCLLNIFNKLIKLMEIKENDLVLNFVIDIELLEVLDFIKVIFFSVDIISFEEIISIILIFLVLFIIDEITSLIFLLSCFKILITLVKLIDDILLYNFVYVDTFIFVIAIVLSSFLIKLELLVSIIPLSELIDFKNKLLFDDIDDRVL